MLFILVAEFFICWIPLYALNTWALFEPKKVYTSFGSVGISLIQMLAYISCVANPLTYFFMHKRFREVFISLLRKVDIKKR
ncbi:Cholecystokinin receptor-like protein [Leptotrombidium deliense]|uniref:Cholecystokinin receptor-like protein n=1 Tax=Leptotrombidium deliense TaxID=299467 RepID=A0A443S8G9_9ACAR|nr:Cholecystokinin receptor-like protein [Leptotrombidium deliense]